MFKNARVVDLCCGTGGFSLSLEHLGDRSIYANDILPESQQIYQCNFPEATFVLGDINQSHIRQTVPDHDILCAGFPCQPYSVAGNRRGFADPRSQVIWSILDVVDQRRPELILLENVPGLISHQGGAVYKL